MTEQTDNSITLDGASLTIEQVCAVAYGQPGTPRVVLSAAAGVAGGARRRGRTKLLAPEHRRLWHHHRLWRL